MRKQQALTALLQGLVSLLAEEAERRPEFGARIDALLADVPEPKAPARKARAAKVPATLPDIHAEFAARGDGAFRAWLAGQPLPVLRAIIAHEDLDAARKTGRMRAADKLAAFIADGLAARRSRGGVFLTGGAEDP